MIKRISTGAFCMILAISLAGCTSESSLTTEYNATTTMDEDAKEDSYKSENNNGDVTANSAITETTAEINHAGTLYTADERGKMTIVGAPDHYDVIVEWSFNPSEMTVWTFSGTFDASGTMNFEDCGRVTTTYFENGEVNEFTTDYLYATGSLSEDGSGALALIIPRDNDVSGSVFH